MNIIEQLLQQARAQGQIPQPKPAQQSFNGLIGQLFGDRLAQAQAAQAAQQAQQQTSPLMGLFGQNQDRNNLILSLLTRLGFGDRFRQLQTAPDMAAAKPAFQATVNPGLNTPMILTNNPAGLTATDTGLNIPYVNRGDNQAAGYGMPSRGVEIPGAMPARNPVYNSPFLQGPSDPRIFANVPVAPHPMTGFEATGGTFGRGGASTRDTLDVNAMNEAIRRNMQPYRDAFAPGPMNTNTGTY